MSHTTGQDATEERGTRIDRYAAERGEQVGTIRKRIQRGQLDAYKGADHRWYVLETVARDATHDTTGQDTRQDMTGQVAINANARAQLEAIRDEWLQPLVETISKQAERIGRLEAERDSVSAQLAAKDETLTAKDELITDLRAELRRHADLRRVAAAQAVPDAPGAQEVPAEAQQDAPGVWGRLARWWRGA